MSVTVFSSGRYRHFSFGSTLGQRVVSAVLLLCIAVGAGAAFSNLFQQGNLELEKARLSRAAETEEIIEIRRKAENQLAALTAKVATLQAQVNRLNMVGERLIDAANLSSDEFNLHQTPAMGGPSQTPTEISLAELNSVLLQLNELERNLQSEQTRFALLETLDLNHQIGKNVQLSGRPVLSGYLSSSFGVRSDPFSGEPAIHRGVDFAGREGDPITATAGGLVTWAGERFGYGLLVEVEHSDGYRTRYAHAKEVSVQIGQMVSKGDQVAVMGSTGRSTGPHVHYEVLRNGQHIDPMTFVNRRIQ